MKNRNAGLDLGRFVAALIVSFGHFLFQDPFIAKWSKDLQLLSSFKLGANAVAFFFGLSGFVLTTAFSSGTSRGDWFRSRLARLMPVYWTCWFIPLLGWYLVSHEFPLSRFGTVLGISASQSLIPSHALDAPNPPLWSLSVEIYLSLIFALFVQMKRATLILTSILLFSVVLEASTGIRLLSNSGVLNALPLFFLGHYLARLSTLRPITKMRFKLMCIAPVLISVLFFPTRLQSISSGPWGSVANLVLIGPLLIGLSAFEFKGLSNRICTELGKRSYSLYACHVPVIYFSRHVFSPKFGDQPLVYTGLVFLIVVLCTEALYRLIERPAVKWSRSIRRKHIQSSN